MDVQAISGQQRLEFRQGYLQALIPTDRLADTAVERQVFRRAQPFDRDRVSNCR
jgi:hypothetical protein